MAPSEVKLMMHEENKEEEVQSSESKSEISEYNDDREIINIDGHVITRQKRVMKFIGIYIYIYIYSIQANFTLQQEDYRRLSSNCERITK